MKALHRPTSCTVCGHPLTPLQGYSGSVCEDWRCRERQLRRELEEHRGVAGEALGVDAPDEYEIAVVPHRPSRLAPLPGARRERFREHLVRLLVETDAANSLRMSEEPTETETMTASTSIDSDLPGSVCAVCEGACCHRGGDHAFLEVERMRRCRLENPIASFADIVDSYVERLPERSYEGSCVFHAASGCALPREMRADVCNEYRCGGLKSIEEHVARTAASRAFIVVRDDHEIRRSAFVEASKIRRFDPE